VTHPLGVQPQGQITARWAGDFPAGTVRLAIAGPASASGGVPAAPPGPSLNPATAPRGHYDVTMVVEGRASACSDSHLTGRVSVSGGGVAGFATDVDLVLLMCPNDNAVSVAIGGFDLP
jgi:hypothetical protein